MSEPFHSPTSCNLIEQFHCWGIELGVDIPLLVLLYVNIRVRIRFLSFHLFGLLRAQGTSFLTPGQ